MNGKGSERVSWNVSVHSGRMRYIKDGRYYLEDYITDMMKRSYPRHKNISFIQVMSTGNRSDLKLFGIIAINAMKNIDREEDLYVRYGSEHTFLNAKYSTAFQ